jgi:hypothetical protein
VFTTPPFLIFFVRIPRSHKKKPATAFLEYIKSKDCAELFRKYGFTLAQ